MSASISIANTLFPLFPCALLAPLPKLVSYKQYCYRPTGQNKFATRRNYKKNGLSIGASKSPANSTRPILLPPVWLRSEFSDRYHLKSVGASQCAGKRGNFSATDKVSKWLKQERGQPLSQAKLLLRRMLWSPWLLHLCRAAYKWLFFHSICAIVAHHLITLRNQLFRRMHFDVDIWNLSRSLLEKWLQTCWSKSQTNTSAAESLLVWWRRGRQGFIQSPVLRECGHKTL